MAVDKDGVEYSASSNNDSETLTLVADGNTSGKKLLFGKKYDATVELSQVFERTEQGHAVIGSKVTLGRVTVSHVNSGPYDVSATRTGASTSTSTHSAAAPVDGTKDVWIGSQSSKTVITLKNDSVMPSTWASIEYQCTGSSPTMEVSNGGS